MDCIAKETIPWHLGAHHAGDYWTCCYGNRKTKRCTFIAQKNIILECSCECVLVLLCVKFWFSEDSDIMQSHFVIFLFRAFFNYLWNHHCSLNISTDSLIPLMQNFGPIQICSKFESFSTRNKIDFMSLKRVVLNEMIFFLVPHAQPFQKPTLRLYVPGVCTCMTTNPETEGHARQVGNLQVLHGPHQV